MMYHGIIALPYEIHVTIHESLDIEAIRCLSQTCKFFDDFLAPRAYRCIQVRSTERSGSALLALAQGPRAKHVKRIQYTVTNPGNDADGGDDTSTSQTSSSESDDDEIVVLPKSVQDALSHVSQFPTIKTVAVSFKFVWSLEHGENLVLAWPVEGEEEEYPDGDVSDLDISRGVTWSRLVRESFTAIAKNTTVERLVIDQLPPHSHKSVGYFCGSFFGFLETLEAFDLTLWGFDNGAGWEANRHWSYQKLCDNLDNHFFRNLNKVTSLRFGTYDGGVLGGNGWTCPHGLKSADQMPLLKHLRLKRIILCEDLRTFLVTHIRTLETIYFEDCWGDLTDDENGSWDGLFTAIIKTAPQKLIEVKIYPDGPIRNDYKRQDDQEDAETIEVMIEQDPGRRIFPYASVDDKYGMLFEGEEENRSKFFEGKDQKAYDELMAIAEVNKAEREEEIEED